MKAFDIQLITKTVKNYSRLALWLLSELVRLFLLMPFIVLSFVILCTIVGFRFLSLCWHWIFNGTMDTENNEIVFPFTKWKKLK